MKANSIISADVATANGKPVAVVFNVKGAGHIRLELAKIHPANMQHAAIHGLIQRISDAAAISRDPETGRPASPEEKMEAMQRLADHYMSGTDQWTRVVAGGPKGGLLFDALCRMYPEKKPEEVRAFLDGLSDKQQAALREDDQVAPIIAAIKAERAKDAPKADTKALLAGLK